MRRATSADSRATSSRRGSAHSPAAPPSLRARLGIPDDAVAAVRTAAVAWPDEADPELDRTRALVATMRSRIEGDRGRLGALMGLAVGAIGGLALASPLSLGASLGIGLGVLVGVVVGFCVGRLWRHHRLDHDGRGRPD